MTIAAHLAKPLTRIEDNLERPTGRLGTAIGRVMSVQHRSLTRWSIEHIGLPSRADILDVGCGSGMALRLMAAEVGSGALTGVDLSPEMVRLTESTNRDLVATGRLRAMLGDALHLPVQDESVDLVTATETFYFWQDPDRGLRECHRVLRPGGRLAVTLEMTRDAAERPTPLQRVFGRSFTERSAEGGLRILSGLELRELMEGAGFVRTRFTVEPRRSLGWVCVVGSK